MGKNQKISSSSCQSSNSSSKSNNEEEDSVVQKKVKTIPKAEESRWELPEDMTKYANKFFQLYIPENELERNVANAIQLPRTLADQKMYMIHISRQPRLLIHYSQL